MTNNGKYIYIKDIIKYLSNNNSNNWKTDEFLSKEFESVGFYISDHPLKKYKVILENYKVKTFSEFENSKETESFIAGTLMSIKEKKTIKGNSFAIVKFSDLSKIFEIFLFSEILEKNRDSLKEGNSFLLTILKDKENQDNRFRRINVRKISKMQDLTKQHYTNVYIEIDKSNNLSELYKVINKKGNSLIKISVKEGEKNYLFELKEKRKIDHEILNILNKEHYIKKINV